MLATVVGVLLLGFAFNLVYDLQEIKSRVLQEKQLTAKIVGSYSVADLVFNDKRAALKSLSYLKSDKSILDAHIHDQNGRYFVSLYGKSYPDDDKHDLHSWYEFRGNTLHVVEPMFLDNKPVGSLHIVANTENYSDLVYQRIIYFLILLLALIVIAILVARKLASVVVEPVDKLTTSAKDFIAGNMKYVTEPAANDELSELTNLYNKMLDAIRFREEERDRAIASLDDKRRELDLILNTMTTGVLSFSSDQTIESYNTMIEKMFGYDSSELLGMSVSNLIRAIAPPDIGDAIEFLSMDNGNYTLPHGLEMTGRTKQGDEFPLYLNIAVLSAKDNEKRFILSCEDITIRKQQDEQIARAQRMQALGSLTGGIAHDHNNILNVINGFSQLILAKTPDEETLRDYMTEILHASQRGSQLIRRLMSFAKREQVSASCVKINDLLESIKNLIQKTITPRIRYEEVLDRDLWNVWLDINDLEDAILNMCINAMHAMDDGGTITITTRNIHIDEIGAVAEDLLPGDYVFIQVADTGIGMDEETIQHIFEPFFTTKHDKGTGLGLSQVYGFVQRSNGHIKVFSEPGHGTHFDFYFPRYTESFISEDLSEEPLPENLDGNEAILIVDDDPNLRLIASEYLGKHGYQVSVADSGANALVILEKQHIDLMVCDVVMPDMDGYQLAEKVHKKYPAIRIQLVSGYSDQPKNDPFRIRLYNAILNKPYSYESFVSRVRNVLDGSSFVGE